MKVTKIFCFSLDCKYSLLNFDNRKKHYSSENKFLLCIHTVDVFCGGDNQVSSSSEYLI